MRQIRQGVFETNSSTQHSLVLRKNKYRTLEDLAKHPNLPKEIVLKIDLSVDYERDYKKQDTIENRIQALFNMVAVKAYEIGTHYLFIFFDKLNELGIKYEIRSNGYDYMSDWGAYPSTFIEKIMDDEEAFVTYIAGELWGGTFCDEGGYEDQIDEWDEKCAKEKNKGETIYLYERE